MLIYDSAKKQQTHTFTRFKMINMYAEQSYLQNEEWHLFNTKRYNIDTTLYITLRIVVLLIFSNSFHVGQTNFVPFGKD